MLKSVDWLFQLSLDINTVGYSIFKPLKVGVWASFSLLTSYFFLFLEKVPEVGTS